jgi:hypothetical protein
MCGIPCEHCGTLMCSKHVHETRGGRSLCVTCYQERKAKKSEHRAAKEHKDDEDTSLAGIEEKDAGEAADEALVVSARKPILPWQWSLYIAAAGVVIVLIVLLFPALRRVPLGGTAYVPTPIILLVFPLLGIVWAAIGLMRVEYYRDRPKCLVGIGLSLLTVILAIVAVRTDPASRVEEKSKSLQEVRDQMTPRQLEDWRKGVLDRYK